MNGMAGIIADFLRVNYPCDCEDSVFCEGERPEAEALAEEIEAAAPDLIREARAAELEAVGAGFMQDYSFQWSEPLLHRLRERAAAIRAEQ